MSRKVVRYIITHLWKCIIAFGIFLIIFAITIFKLPEIVAEIIASSLALLFFATLFISLHKEKQQFQSRDKEYYEKKWIQYVDLVNEIIDEKKYGLNKLNSDWI